MHIIHTVGWYSASLTLSAMEPWDFTLNKKYKTNEILLFCVIVGLGLDLIMVNSTIRNIFL
jgi:hypothetical protein